jgi:hypothetical protein
VRAFEDGAPQPQIPIRMRRSVVEGHSVIPIR